MDDFNFDCVLQTDSDEEEREEEILESWEEDIREWLHFCSITEHEVQNYYKKQRQRIKKFPFARNGHMFMLELMEGNGRKCYQEFRMYPPMLRHFAHILRDEFGLESGQHVDIYEQVGMFLCILVHGKGYRQVQTLFNHLLQTIGHYYKNVLRAVVAFAARLIKPDPNYNQSPTHHRPDARKHSMFHDCIGAIDGTHVRAVLPRHQKVHFIGRKGIPTQNVLAACDFNLCFTFVLPGTTGNTHDARILARAIYTPDIHFPKPAQGKYYLVDSGFAHRPGYMAKYKGSDILYHFQQFRDDATGHRRRFRNARERFNFKHSSCRNVIERAFGVWKQRWKILDRMPSYSFRAQTAVVVATMGIHNFLRKSGVVDEAFIRAETDPSVAEVELPNEEEEIAAEMNALEIQRSEWDQLRDYMAQHA